MCRCSAPHIIFVGPLEATTSSVPRASPIFFSQLEASSTKCIHPLEGEWTTINNNPGTNNPALASLLPSTRNTTMIRVDRRGDLAVPDSLSESTVWALRYDCGGLPPLFALLFTHTLEGKEQTVVFAPSTSHIVFPQRAPCFEALLADRHFAGKNA